MLALAEDLGRMIGTVQHKADTLLDKRESVSRRLVQIRDTASHMLSQLGDQVNSGYETVAGVLSKPARKSSGRKAAATKKKVAATRAKATPAPATAVAASSRRARVAKDDEARRRLSAKTHAQRAASSAKPRRAPR